MDLKRRLIDAAFFGGFGITLHAVASELFYKAGYSEILSFHGEYIGLALMAVAYIILIIQKEGKCLMIKYCPNCGKELEGNSITIGLWYMCDDCSCEFRFEEI